MDRHDLEIVHFVLRWIPFGGPPADEIFPRFGLDPRQLGRRFDEIVSRMKATEAELSADERELLAAIRRGPPNASDDVSRRCAHGACARSQ